MQTGRGDAVGARSGSIAAPRMTSSAATHQRFFLRDAAGKEHFVDWCGPSLPARPGNRISIMWGGGKSNSDTSEFLIAANLDTGDIQPNADGLTAFAVDSKLLRRKHRVWFVAMLALAASLLIWSSLLGDAVRSRAHEVQAQRVQRMAYPVPEVDQVALARAERRVDAARVSGTSQKQFAHLLAEMTDARSKIADDRERFHRAREKEIPLELDVLSFFLTSAGLTYAAYLGGIWLLACIPAVLVERALFHQRRAAEFSKGRETIQAGLSKLFRDGYSLRL
ncbi:MULTISPECIES: hypothetical protein [unclassified Variovorax]|uniref:hypothetical protein n=1 Tax=unclassified Variovorax TaxID=663243 RepID=UPI001160B017|nr:MULTISPECIES: hypothetical protein [unclassified Variovorax]